MSKAIAIIDMKLDLAKEKLDNLRGQFDDADANNPVRVCEIVRDIAAVVKEMETLANLKLALQGGQ